MEPWQTLIQNSITTLEDLQEHINCDTTALGEVIANFPMRINPYFLNLIQYPGDPIWKQAVPDKAEILDNVCTEDPLNEDNLSPVPNLVHKYPDRVLFLVSSQCAMYCRFCTRKRKSEHFSAFTCISSVFNDILLCNQLQIYLKT